MFKCPRCLFAAEPTEHFTKIALEDHDQSILDVSTVTFEVVMPPHLEAIVFHGTISTLDAVETMMSSNISGVYLRFGDGEVSHAASFRGRGGAKQEINHS